MVYSDQIQSKALAHVYFIEEKFNNTGSAEWDVWSKLFCTQSLNSID